MAARLFPHLITFRKRLLDWYAQFHRDLPWRTTTDPYAIWVSEIMLQQTRVATVLPYYERWMQRFPTVQSLAEAPEQEVLQLWSGLGYYSRARNLLRAARQIDGSFPSDYNMIRSLAGVGDYTAAAISSIAFGGRHAAVDGNVLRVVSRLTNDSGDIGSAATKNRLAEIATRFLDSNQPGLFNQAMMELGATLCLPKNPQCLTCPVQNLCEALSYGTQHELPVKLRRADPVRIDRILLIVKRHQRMLFWQRPPDSRKMAGFWELPEPKHLPEASQGQCLGYFRHSISNHNYRFAVCEGFVNDVNDVNSDARNLRWLKPTRVEYLFSTTTRKALALVGVAGFKKNG
jgi:A/G-specific adenine glycosylase